MCILYRVASARNEAYFAHCTVDTRITHATKLGRRVRYRLVIKRKTGNRRDRRADPRSNIIRRMANVADHGFFYDAVGPFTRLRTSLRGVSPTVKSNCLTAG